MTTGNTGCELAEAEKGRFTAVAAVVVVAAADGGCWLDWEKSREEKKRRRLRNGAGNEARIKEGKNDGQTQNFYENVHLTIRFTRNSRTTFTTGLRYFALNINFFFFTNR
ncbi:hypothetical protein GGTG_04851 [Gaeumannomyces tritici R3-111a-1]|uniref:Uncharacterized protein n=1 Tax=Gaeumannomyces tritici (strain R3-111a-1) TaxID=644352 RepID=J3NU97_GAET3|nr:hypothetical protein GGTG_04851 [Gaeumannomyces tritici R3-111a-1]EJT79768.1 hypothetical protein GGTG_04851 [Gaeumannomyces tritici R3-111a-1]